MIEDCKRGNHDLVEIASTTVGIDEEKLFDGASVAVLLSWIWIGTDEPILAII